MFTGIVESVGTIAQVQETEGGRTLVVEAAFAAELVPGQSVAVDGACLTVRSLHPHVRGPAIETPSAAPQGFAVEAGPSTLERTVAGDYRPGARVNLERGVRAGDRLDGHLVQGHVDGTGALLASETRGLARFMTFRLPEEVFATTVLHGSIAINGVSLTVNELGPGAACQVAIVPYTWEHTNFPALAPGDPVNVEADLVGKYVQRILRTRPILPSRDPNP